MLDSFKGDTGPIGEPGPHYAPTEQALVGYLIAILEQDADWFHGINMGDGHNHRVSVDAYALRQAVDALRNYEALLTHPIDELVSPFFFHIRRGQEQ